jgi:hypothetical protein
MNFMQGTLDVLILTALADGPLHGYDVVEWIRSATNDALKIDDGALWPRASYPLCGPHASIRLRHCVMSEVTLQAITRGHPSRWPIDWAAHSRPNL